MHFITALLKKIREADISKKKTIQLLGTGKPLRQFMYAKDLALAILTMIQNDITDSFNVAPKFNYSIDDMAKMSIKSLGKKLTVNYPSKSLDGQYRKDVSSAKMLKLMPNFKFTGFKQGITKVYNAILEKENNE
jgi:GDP-L-fucose synthase